MDKKAALEMVDRFRQGLDSRGIRPQKIILYGSYARGANREGSDIDLVVISDDFAGKNFWERIDILVEVIYEIFSPIEAVAMTPEEWAQEDSFVVSFARDGEVLYTA